MSARDTPWDGRVYPYKPPRTLTVNPDLPRHSDRAEGIDPITHEVLRYALWNLNIEHGNTIMKVSGSPVAAYGHDFSPVVLDENGDYVFFGPYLQYLATPTSSAVKWTLEHRSWDPGIEPGDMYLTNDPWIGAAHQGDAALVAPLFVDGQLFCWLGNVLHQWDLGGTAPGGFSPIARDVFWESPCIPPIKVVEAGKVRRDVEEMYTRQSRVPDLIALDLRAQIAGVRVAVERMTDLLGKYGAAVVKASMRKLQDDSERAFVARLETIPDGTWTEESWIEAATSGDRGAYRNRIALTKEGNVLTFTNEGSAPQAGTLGASYLGWKGGILSMLCAQTLFDQMFVIEGALRHCRFEAEPGLISCATRPAAVAGAPAGTIMNTMGVAGLVISKMLSCSSDPGVRNEANSCMGTLTFPINEIHGLDQRKQEYVSFLQDVVGGALGAWPWRDGQDTGGWPWDLQSTMPNVENNEQFFPVLYLWRRELPDSGGAGQYRGGNSGEFAVIPHKTERISMTTFTSQLAIPGPGLHGGYPGATNKYQLVRGAHVAERLRNGGTIPSTEADLRGTTEWTGEKEFDVSITTDDAWICAWTAGGGYGDPLLRSVELVEQDVAAGVVTAGWALKAYGVRVGDPEGTEALRRERFAHRLGRQPAATPVANPERSEGVQISAAVVLNGDGWSCRHCGSPLGPMDRDYRDGAVAFPIQLSDANPYTRDPRIYIDVHVETRAYACGACGVLLQCDIVVAGDAPHLDVVLTAPNVPALVGGEPDEAP